MNAGEEYLDLFFDEVDTSLESLNEQLAILAKNPAQASIIAEIFRIVHTVKGMAATIGFNSISRVCHKMEELFDFYRKNPRKVPKETIECEQKALDGLFKIIENLASNDGEETSISRTLSEALCKELEDELNKLNISPVQANTKQNIDPERKIEIKIKFAEDCLMPGVRAFMTTQVLEKTGQLIESDPPTEAFLDNMEIVANGLKAIISTSKPLEQIQNRLLKISDVVKVEIAEKEKVSSPIPLINLSKEENQNIEQQNNISSFINSHEKPPEELEKLFSDFQRHEIANGNLNAFQVDLFLSDEVINAEEQFFNLLNNLNEYLGQVIYSYPSILELGQKKDIAHEAKTISNLLASEASKFTSRGEKLHFVVLVNGSHKNILDFLSDACELNKVEVKEIEFSWRKKIESDVSIEAQSEAKSVQEENKDLSFTKSGDVKTAFVRVNMATLESLMNSVGELVINHNRIKLAMGDTATNEERSILQYLHQVTTKIQQLVMSIRMVPVNQVFTRFPRFIRDVSRELQKEVLLEVEGENTEIDRLMVDELNEVFIHLVRNAIDHGIETSEERLKKDKPKAGTIRMQAYAQGNNVFITIADDGRGIDPQNIKKKAIQKGLLSPEEAEIMDHNELLDLIFATGFSTADKVSDLSGRGVGMDVVKSRVSALGGQIFINSIVGEGTSVRLSIPSTISIIQALLINDGSGLYAIPLSQIREIVRISIKEEVYKIGSCEIILLHNETIPLIDLSKYIHSEDFSKHSQKNRSEALIVVIVSEEKSYALIVDSLVGQQEIVIKPISPKANQEGLVNGATVFGDGRVAMILNVDQIIKLYLLDHESREFPSDEQGEEFLYWASKY